MSQFGSVPTQLGSYDWSLQIQGWLFKTGSSELSGGQGMYGTVEAAYPYILLPQQQANSICELRSQRLNWVYRNSPDTY